MSQSRQKRREYGNISEDFNDEWGKIYILKPPLVLVVKATALSKYRIEQSQEFLNSAVKNLEINEHKTANNRAYYSIFHGMRAVLALDEVDFNGYIHSYLEKLR